MTLGLTLKEAQIWKGIQSGELMYRGYARSPEFIKKDREIAKMLAEGKKPAYISRKLKTSHRRISRVRIEMWRGLL
jgi:DNA-binding NarL/FixJ family response regulator